MMMRLLGPQGIAGIVVGTCLAGLLLLQKAETRRWRDRSAEHAAFAATVADYRAAAHAARAADLANATRVAAEQSAINERTSHDFEARLAAARAVAERLRREGKSPADPGRRGGAAMSGLSAAAGGIAQGAGENRLPDALLATEQAIQLDELIKWVRQQHAIRVDGVSGERPGPAEQQAPVEPNPAK